MIWFVIALIGGAAWLCLGHLAGRRAAPIAYRRTRNAYSYSAARDVEYGQGTAAFAYASCLVGGPLGWLYVLAHEASYSAVPELRTHRAERREKAYRAEIEAMQRQIDEAHRALGIVPMNRSSA